MTLSSFNQNTAPLKYGRFYPARILKTSLHLPAGFFRVKAIDGKEFAADFNHPLAGKKMAVKKASLQSESPVIGKPQMLLEWAGIDAPLDEKNTDFSIPQAFDRKNPSDDSFFYKQPRKAIRVDQTCVSRIKKLYSDLVKPENEVLDLMSSRSSHLPQQKQRVTGLGMNPLEMADNPQLNSYVVHDLNRNPDLPFNDGGVDVVVNTVSIE